MAWCPKCKAQYVDGITMCADCKIELVDSPSIQYVEKNQRSESLEESYEEESTQENVEEECTLKDKSRKKSPSSAYMSSAQRVEDNRSSAYILLLVGGLGLLAVILMIAGVIPFMAHSSTRYLTYGVMGGLFVIFIVMGIVSWRNAKKYASKAAFEEELTSEMRKWCLANLTKEKIAQMLPPEERNQPEELIYFSRMQIIRACVSAQYMNLDLAFLERFVEDIYAEIFES